MREIKFRAYMEEYSRVINSAMAEVYDIDIKSGTVTLGEDDRCVTTEFIEDVKLMQYIGVQDKNKQDIFGGDIVLLSEIVHEVRFSNASFMLFKNNQPYVYNVHWNLCEVIGNIYENKELLNS